MRKVPAITAAAVFLLESRHFIQHETYTHVVILYADGHPPFGNYFTSEANANSVAASFAIRAGLDPTPFERRSAGRSLYVGYQGFQHAQAVHTIEILPWTPTLRFANIAHPDDV